ncbi:hypothetical protein BWGOE5_37030 [Bacillus mycoides]|nr:hypothetical protein BWGOE5_37030 [Bacillus mycoides]
MCLLAWTFLFFLILNVKEWRDSIYQSIFIF